MEFAPNLSRSPNSCKSHLPASCVVAAEPPVNLGPIRGCNDYLRGQTSSGRLANLPRVALSDHDSAKFPTTRPLPRGTLYPSFADAKGLTDQCPENQRKTKQPRAQYSIRLATIHRHAFARAKGFVPDARSSVRGVLQCLTFSRANVADHPRHQHSQKAPTETEREHRIPHGLHA
jgi:hypothetical protein